MWFEFDDVKCVCSVPSELPTMAQNSKKNSKIPDRARKCLLSTLPIPAMNVPSGNHMVVALILDWIFVLMQIHAWKVVKFKFYNAHGLYLLKFY